MTAGYGNMCDAWQLPPPGSRTDRRGGSNIYLDVKVLTKSKVFLKDF